MIHVLFILLALTSACVAIHGIGMILGIRWLGSSWPQKDSDFTPVKVLWLLVRLVYGLLILHLIQIIVWAGYYQLGGCFPDFNTSFYYSASSYSTVGYGDVIPSPQWRILGAIEAVTGVLMFGWSTGVLFPFVNHLVTQFRHPVRTARS